MAFPKVEGYVVTERLGSGSYSTVYKAYTKVGGRSIVAVKCVDRSKVKHSGTAVDNLITEIRLLKTLTHPHIVQMKEFTWDDKNIYIITEFCCGGDLSKYIHRYGRVPEKQVLYFLQQLASALKFLREKGVVHMDLKPHNLLLHKDSDGKYILKVADFGFAQLTSEAGGGGARGSPLYMAPEVVRGRYDARADLWSVGVIMYECLFGRAPYSSTTLKELVDKIQNQAPIEIPRNSCISVGCQDLLTRLLQHDPDRRITYEELFAHEYLDLEHMPSKENYQKAVQLIKQAIELDSNWQLKEALQAYSAALRLLVAAARAHTDTLAKEALTAKVTRYMERAEEIKQYLKYCETGVAPGDDVQQRLHPTPSECKLCNSKAESNGPTRGTCTCGPDGQTAEQNGEQTLAVPEATTSCDKSDDRSSDKSSDRRGGRRGLRRLLSFVSPAKQQPATSDGNEICRIT
ncbi:serine/threonine-protein kinase ULK3-like isoform X2 [Achroia grisella]|uniref:serine/threonine-protein kinase ULK3-like isoform X2 n=1 Tax=Achroia grisella TaxID=688607 RepID=UPI0027D34993|nr:serine/threonine-protein kinase ULK3-like isoform X2 [Achroia grisella]